MPYSNTPLNNVSTLHVEPASFLIERGVPLPHKAQTTKFPTLSLAVGDSFHVPFSYYTDNPSVRTVYGRIHSHIKMMRDRTGRKFSTRRDATGLRVWRVA
jgi:hypothetical protein